MMRAIKRYFGAALVSLALFAVGCTHGASDPQIQSAVQNKINQDNAIPDKQLTVTADNGVVTLSGSVSNDAARVLAAEDAAKVEGVKTVVNNLSVGPASAAVQPPPQPEQPAASAPPSEPARSEARSHESKSSPARRSRASNGDSE